MSTEEEGEDYYDIRLTFRPARRFRGQPGVEQFIIDKVGTVRVRQVLDEPVERPPSQLPYAAAGILAVVGAVIGILFGAGILPQSDSEPPVVVVSQPTPTVSPTPTPTPTPIPTVHFVPPLPENSIVLAYDGWTGSYLSIYVLKQVFEEELGYQVQISDQQTIPAAFEAVASGDADIFASAWFPARDSTIDKFPNLVKLGQVYGGKDRDAFEGLMLSASVSEQYGVTHLDDLADPALVRALDIDGNGAGNLIGCPPDWVCSARIPEILADYGLSGIYEVEEQRNEEQMLATIAERVGQGQPAIFYSYQPVAFPEAVPVMDRAVWLKGTEAYLALAFARTVVKDDFLASRPSAAKILQRYQITGADISASMEQIIAAGDEGSSPEFLAQLARIG